MRGLSVAAIILNKQRHVLLLKRRDVPIWVLPGGGIDPGETPENAILREISEETGCQARIIRKVAEYTPINCLGRQTTTFLCEIVEGTPKTGQETADIDFYSPERFPSDLFHIHQEMIEDAFQAKHVLIKPLTNVTWKKFFLYFFRHPLRVFRFILSQIGIPWNS